MLILYKKETPVTNTPLTKLTPYNTGIFVRDGSLLLEERDKEVYVWKDGWCSAIIPLSVVLAFARQHTINTIWRKYAGEVAQLANQITK